MQPNVCVIMHCGYPDELYFYIPYLKNLTIEYDFYVSITSDNFAKYEEIVATLKTISPNVVTLMVENRGLDGGGWFVVVDYILKSGKQYEYVLKLHTKSPINHSPLWRKALMDAIAGSPERVQICLERMQQDRVGMIGCYRWVMTEGHRADFARFAQSLGFAIRPPFTFVAGTMFWAKFPLVSAPLASKNLLALVSTFPEGKPDGETAGHMIERLLGNLVVQAGKDIVGI